MALLFAGAAIWLLLAAVPVLADGGIHVAASNSGFSTLTADGCAGCHRAHTAQGEYLLRADNANDLCLTCHGASGTGATADVMTGVQYKLSAGVRDTTPGTTIGALRDGGFDQARIASASPSRWTYLRTATEASFRAKVSVNGSPVDVTSAHLDLDGTGGVTAKDVAWGNGTAGTGAGPTVTIECVSCHNPHGNGQYRILNTLPEADGAGFVDPVAIPVTSWSSTAKRFTTSEAHGFVVGDLVVFKDVTTPTPAALPLGLTSNPYVVRSVPNGVTFTLAATTPGSPSPADVVNSAVAIGSSGSSSTLRIQRFEATVADAPPPAAGDERNYSVLQVRGYQGTPATYLLYASDVQSARSGGSFDLSVDIVGLTVSGVAITIAGVDYTATDFFTTGLAHGFAVGDSITIADLPGYNGTFTIASIPSPNTFTLTGVTVAADQTAASTVGARLGTATKHVAGTFSATSGDYFHRTVPWDPQAINPSCPYDTFVDSAVFANQGLVSACTTANDAPNGRPATVTSKLKVNGVSDAVTPSAFGQIAFNDQISAWCSTCHSRYYSSTNPNPGTEPNSSTDLPRTVANVSANTITVSPTLPAPGSGTITSVGFAVGDRVQFVGGSYSPTNLAGNTYYVLTVGSGATALNFTVSNTYDGAPVTVTGASSFGTVVRLYPASASSWWFPRPGDTIYKYQHQTTTNRACVTCHVSHGSNAAMPGTESGSVTYPNDPTGSLTTAGYNSRLLKVDNRGTCQMCHDPTGTSEAGDLLPLSLGGTPPTVP